MSDEPKIPAPKKPRTFEEVFQENIMSPEEEAAFENEVYAGVSPKASQKGKDEQEAADPLKTAAATPRDPNEVPDWVSFPPNFKIPRGKTVVFFRFRAEWTEKPEKGDRWCMLWPLSDAEEKLAIKRTRGESGRTLSELSKQCLRLIGTIDSQTGESIGKRVNWTGDFDEATDASPDRFWADLGKCRSLVQNYFVKAHQLSAEETADFFTSCVVAVTAK